METKDLKKLVVYYSFEGNTRFIGKAIAQEIGADILDLKPKKELNSHGFMKYVKGGCQVLFKRAPELYPFTLNLEDYELIFIGTPVWAWNYAPPLRTFFSRVELKGKKIALFCCNGGDKGKTFLELKKRLTGNELLGEIEFLEPLKKNSEQSQSLARQWAKKIVSKF